MNGVWFVWSGAQLFLLCFISLRRLLHQTARITLVMQSHHKRPADVPLLKIGKKGGLNPLP